MARSEVSEERRIAIVAATRMLASEGITETTRKIAAKADVNQAMIGYYLGGKDELLYAVLRELMRRTGEIAGASLPRGASFAETLTEALEACWEHVEEAPELEVMEYELTLYALRNPASAWLAKRQYEGYCEVVAGLIEQVCDATAQRIAAPLSYIPVVVGVWLALGLVTLAALRDKFIAVTPTVVATTETANASRS